MTVVINGSGVVTGVPPIGGPAFASHASATSSLVQNVATKVTFGAEEFDTNSCYDPTTSRFTPNVAGYYWVGAGLRLASAAAGLQIFVYKNGVLHREVGAMSGSNQQTSGGVMVSMNGSTDYIEIFVTQTAATQNNIAQQEYTYFYGFMVRGT